MDNVAIVDYGSGNLFSLARAFEAVGASVNLTCDKDEIQAASRVVLPGVGAFGHAVQSLRKMGLFGTVRRFAESGGKFLGICVGMQMMMEFSREFGENQGLGLVCGQVDIIPSTGTDGSPHPVPHIGWSALGAPAGHWKGTLLEGVDIGQEMYFLHSYSAQPKNSADVLATTFYNGREIVAAIQLRNMTGVQFHPEKSGIYGLAILSNFLKGPSHQAYRSGR